MPDIDPPETSLPEKSSYLRYLPPVLWEREPPLPAFSLGAMLRIFEKILTGIPDGVQVEHTAEDAEGRPRTHVHEPITATIENVHRLFDPWQAPADFLPWLASWVALEFPALQGKLLWDEYQQRKVTSVITQIYRQRGLKEGLNRYLELYAVGATRPRVVVDDGSRLLIARPTPGTVAPVAALVSKGPVVVGSDVLVEGLVRPRCIAAGAGDTLFVGDIGISSNLALPIANRVWRISTAGKYDMAGSPPRPQPIARDNLRLTSVAGLAVRPAQGNQPEALYILDGGREGNLFTVPAPYTDTAATLVTALAAPGSTFTGVAMALDTDGSLLILEAGDGPESGNLPKIITVQLNPLKVSRRPLATVLAPLALLVLPDGRLVIVDGREQQPVDESQHAGNLVLVDRSVAANWTETLLLPERNPLVAPVAVVREGDAQFYVLDAGLKPFKPPDDPFLVAVAEPPAVYRVDFGTVPPTADPPAVSRATETGQLVYPRDMVGVRGDLFICDPGQPEYRGGTPEFARLQPFRFNVVVHFADSRLPADFQERATIQRQVVGNIRTIVEAQKPAHTVWTLITSTPDVV